MTIIDTHAHMDQIEDIEAAVAHCIENNVSDVVAMSVDLASMQKNFSLSTRFVNPRIHLSLGIHPGTIKPEEQQDAHDFFQAHLPHAKAIGETGLDFWYKWVRKNEEERQKQRVSFAWHLNMAKAHDLPIVIHSRGAWKEALAMAQSAKVKHALFHWYSGPVDVLGKILDAGYYVSTSPSVGYSKESREAMAHAPLERILIETDSPVRYRDESLEYLAEPKDVWKTLKALTILKGEAEDKVLMQVNKNAKDFFRI